ncbi:OmpH family outer membrane protein [Alteraurantiacibacter buctensis]|uniref:OmpH family outer membrane protein n=1 Tax=Alteraurantiacibacter buctensis TaxID=1503981 RepID=A0A844Z3Q8_9SPHN|nr:OmpH family outer membrane protein [Alteraurantiacibacter buctensis]MXO72493.1 OmpH family outer membrane protein [Alteraurantiacibacter buctensis]
MMKTFLKPALAAGIALAALSAPAAAQVNGMAMMRAPVAIAQSQALLNAFQAIDTANAAQITQIGQLAQQRAQLLQAIDTNGNGQLEELDTNGDGNLDQAEQTANPSVTQAAGLEQQINTLQQPIQLAQLYVVTQVAEQAGPAAQQVVTERNVSVLIEPEAVRYAAQGFDITPLVVTALNTRFPTAQTTVPAGWQPTDEGAINLYQQVLQVLQALAARQQAAAAPAAEGR